MSASDQIVMAGAPEPATPPRTRGDLKGSTSAPAFTSIRPEERERELVEIARLARLVADEHTEADHTPKRRRGAGRSISWPLVVALGVAGGIIVGLLAAVALIPDQPDRVLIPVEQPAPSAHVPEGGARA